MIEPNKHAYAFTKSFWGPYFVKYNDGEISCLMTEGTANDYASMFGGTVHRHSEHPTTWQRFKRFFQTSVERDTEEN